MTRQTGRNRYDDDPYMDQHARGDRYDDAESGRSRYGNSQSAERRRYDNAEYDSRRYDGRSSGGSRTKTRKRGGFGTVLTTILLIIAIGVFGYSAYKLYGYWREYRAGENEYSDLNKQYVQLEPVPETSLNNGSGTEQGEQESGGVILSDVSELETEATLPQKIEAAKKEDVEENGTMQSLPEMYNPVNFKELQAINPEVIGWIRVGGAGISYPIAQTDNNEYYLHHTFKKEEVFSGCIFLNCDNSKYFTDQNTIIYGHNMKDGSMFASLRKFWEDQDAVENPYFWVFTPDFIYQYRIFSSSIVSKIGDPYRTRFLTEDFQTFIDTCKSATEVDWGDVSVTTSDRIVTLSTCTGDDNTRRIVQGKLQQVYVAKYRE